MSVEVKEETLGNNDTYIYIRTDFPVILEFLIPRPEFFFSFIQDSNSRREKKSIVGD